MNLRHDKPPVVIGMMRGKGTPGTIAVANAHAAALQGAEFIFFTPDDVNIQQQSIEAARYVGGTWQKKTVGYPDVIDNDELSRSSKEVWNHISQKVPITTHMLGGKLDVLRGMKDADIYADLLIPGDVLRNFQEFLSNLHFFERSVVKPVRGSMGREIFFFERKDDRFDANLSGVRRSLSVDELYDFYNQTIRGRNFLHQKFIESKSRKGLPFDIRIHVRRDHQAQWRTVKIYARVGAGNTVASNLSAGGSISLARAFLMGQFGDAGEGIYKRLLALSRDFPVQFQRLYPDRMLDALGIDVGLDQDGQPWLFEVNSFPGAMFFEIEDAIPRVGYAIYLAKQAQQGYESVQITA